MVERQPSKLNVASSTLVSRSILFIRINFYRYMVTVVQLVERQFVALVVAGSSPVSHPINNEPLAQSVEHLTFNQGVTGSIPVWLTIYKVNEFARVAKLVYALDLGSSVFDMWVRVPPFAPLEIKFLICRAVLLFFLYILK